MAAVVGVVSASGHAQARKEAPTEWDGLTRVKSKRLEFVYLAPDADFRPYTKVSLDPTEIAFRKNWQRDYNSTKMGLTGRVNDSDVQRVIAEGGKAASAIFAQAFTEGGYPVTAAPAADVIRIRTAIVNLTVSAPDMRTAGRSTTYAQEAGQASLIVEARDSMTGALLGRAVDHRLAGDTGAWMRNSVTNKGDFRVLVKQWAKNAVVGLNTLKASTPAGSGV
jgi:hypothetical protein